MDIRAGRRASTFPRNSREKLEEERMKKVGWFRKEENLDKRDLLINEYVDENFETQLKKEMDLD